MSRFDADIVVEPNAIARLTTRTRDFLLEAGVDEHAAHHVAVVLDEMLNNVDLHGDRRGSPAIVRIAVEADRVRGEIVDSGPFFDPRAAPDPNLRADIADRPIGGLGLFLIRKVACELDYVRRGDQNLTTFSILRR